MSEQNLLDLRDSSQSQPDPSLPPQKQEQSYQEESSFRKASYSSLPNSQRSHSDKDHFLKDNQSSQERFQITKKPEDEVQQNNKMSSKQPVESQPFPSALTATAEYQTQAQSIALTNNQSSYHHNNDSYPSAKVSHQSYQMDTQDQIQIKIDQNVQKIKEVVLQHDYDNQKKQCDLRVQSLVDKAFVEQFSENTQKTHQDKNGVEQRTWMNFEIGSFFAQVEMLEKPHLINDPVAVGDKTMIISVNSIAKEKFNIKDGQSGNKGFQICPQLELIKPDYTKYRAFSELFHSMISQYDPNFESSGLDECSLDVTDYLKLWNQNTNQGRKDLATIIRKQLKKELGLSISIGVAPNKMLAKICCSQLQIQEDDQDQSIKILQATEVKEFMSKLPIKQLPGMGKANSQVLEGMQIQTCQNLLDKAFELEICFTQQQFEYLIKSASGLSANRHDPTQNQKQISLAILIPLTEKYEAVAQKLEQLCNLVSQRATQNKVQGKTLTVEFKNCTYKARQKQFTSPTGTLSRQDEILNCATSLLEQCWPLEPVRMISVKLSGLKDITVDPFSRQAAQSTAKQPFGNKVNNHTMNPEYGVSQNYYQQQYKPTYGESGQQQTQYALNYNKQNTFQHIPGEPVKSGGFKAPGCKKSKGSSASKAAYFEALMKQPNLSQSRRQQLSFIVAKFKKQAKKELEEKEREQAAQAERLAVSNPTLQQIMNKSATQQVDNLKPAEEVKNETSIDTKPLAQASEQVSGKKMTYAERYRTERHPGADTGLKDKVPEWKVKWLANKEKEVQRRQVKNFYKNNKLPFSKK